MKVGAAIRSWLMISARAASARKLSDELACPGGGHGKYRDGILVGGDRCAPETYCCQGADACAQFSGTVCHGNATHPNCNGDSSCRYANIGTVKDGSCVGEGSCFNANIGVAEGSGCVGVSSCSSTTASAIRDNSCVGPGACKSAELGRVEGESCIEEYACEYVESAALAIRSRSCWGHRSCHESKVQEFIQEGSCQGNYTCHFTDMQALSVNKGEFRFPTAPKCDAEYCGCVVKSTAASHQEVLNACPRFQNLRLTAPFYYENPLNLTALAPPGYMRECYKRAEHRYLYFCVGGSSWQMSASWNCNHFYRGGNGEVWSFYTTDGLNLPPFCSDVDLSFILSYEPSFLPSREPSLLPSLDLSFRPSLEPLTRPSTLPSYAPTIIPPSSPMFLIVSASPTKRPPKIDSSSAKVGAAHFWQVSLIMQLVWFVL